MKYAKIYSAQLSGLSAEIISAETDISNGLHSFSLVGLGDKAVNESKDRVSSAVKNSGFISPKQKNQKVVVSLAPAQSKKEGSMFDLAIALSYLSATGDVRFEAEGKLFFGELSLEGKLRPGRGLLPIILQAKVLGFREIFIPQGNVDEARMVKGVRIYAAGSLREVIDHLISKKSLNLVENSELVGVNLVVENEHDMSPIKGNAYAKRALEIAAVGRHSFLLYGPPGAGKTMLAKAFISIMPPLSEDERVEVASIRSIGNISSKNTSSIPFRAPHHTTSYAALLGGGQGLRPGEITFAHRGVLFLDEFPEFDRRFIEALRQPLEEKRVTVTRLKGSITYPADCILITAMNPCPCGYGDHRCICGEKVRNQYRSRISGPILDRIDMFISVKALGEEELAGDTSAENSVSVRERVIQAREFAKKIAAAQGTVAATRKNSKRLSKEARSALIVASRRLGLSARSYDRIIGVAESIANLAQSEMIEKEHLLEALQYRRQF